MIDLGFSRDDVICSQAIRTGPSVRAIRRVLVVPSMS